MTDSLLPVSDEQPEAGLAGAFRGWTETDPDPAPFLSDGLVALDANALLHLYRVTPPVRAQVLATLARLGDRLWIPHQAALEFHRNRIEVVTGKMRRFNETRRSLDAATAKAVQEIRKAVAQLVDFRQHNMTERGWDPAGHGLDEKAIEARLDGVLAPALAELEALRSEHDITPKEVGGDDSVLRELETVTRGRIGRPYDQRRLRELVAEAIDFRFPNEIPPGYKDAAAKAVPHRAAGDYILWRQVLDRAAGRPRVDRLVLVTNDVKADWWVLDKAGKPERTRPELRQEMSESSGSEMILLTLSGFLESAGQLYPGSVGPATVEAVRESEDLATLPRVVLLSDPYFETVPRDVYQWLGCSVVRPAGSGAGGFQYDVVRDDTTGATGVAAVDRRGAFVVAAELGDLYAVMQEEGAEFGLFLGGDAFTSQAVDFAQSRNIRCIGRAELRKLGRAELRKLRNTDETMELPIFKELGSVWFR